MGRVGKGDGNVTFRTVGTLGTLAGLVGIVRESVNAYAYAGSNTSSLRSVVPAMPILRGGEEARDTSSSSTISISIGDVNCFILRRRSFSAVFELAEPRGREEDQEPIRHSGMFTVVRPGR